MSATETAEQTPEPGMNAPAPSTVPPPPLTKTLLYSAANFGYGTFYALNNATLTLYLSQRCPGISNIILGLMGSSHSVEGAVIQPLVGAASDRLRTPYGRRRPFMLLFVPLASLFMLLTPAAGHLPVGGRLLALVGCIFLFTVFFNIAADPYQALLPDVFPSEQRGRVTGISMFLLVLGQAGLVLLPLPLETKFGLVAIIMLLTTFITCLTIREPTHSDPLAKHSHLRELRTALGGLRTLRQAEKALLAVFFYGVGVGAVTPFLTLFVKKITGCSDHSAELMFLALMGSTAVGVLPFGWLSDRVGPKKVLLLGMVLIAVASLNGLWVGNLTQIAFVMLLAGLGNAAQSASAYPLLTQVVPGEEVGFYTGLQSTALSIAAPLTSVVTGKLIDLGGNYRWIFAVCSISVLIGLAALVSVRMNSAGAEVAERDRQQGRVTQGA